MSRLQIKKQRAQRKGHFPHKIDDKWFVVYSAEHNSDIYGPFASRREAINYAYHNSLQKKLVITITVTKSDGSIEVTEVRD